MQNKILMYIGIVAAILPFIVCGSIVFILIMMKSTGKKFPSTTKDRIKTSVLAVILNGLNVGIAIFLFYNGWIVTPIIIIGTILLAYVLKYQTNSLMEPEPV